MRGSGADHRSSRHDRADAPPGVSGTLGTLRLLDLAPLGPANPGEELVTADIRDLAAVNAAASDVDAIVHLAGIPQEDTFERIS